MTDYLQAQTQGTTSVQQSAGVAEDQPANVVKYSYPDTVATLTDVVPQDTPTGALPSTSEGFDVPADSVLRPIPTDQTTPQEEVASAIAAVESTDDDVPSNADQASGDGAEVSIEPEVATEAPAEDATKAKSKKATA